MTALWRLHLRPLLADRVRTTLAVLGVALGTALVLAVTVLGSEVGRPFDLAGALLHPPATGTLVEVTPIIQARLPQDRAAALAHVEGVTVAAAVIAERTPIVGAGGAEESALLLGTDGCGLAPLLARDPCAALAGRVPAPGPGVPLVVSRTLAAALGTTEGAPVALPGGRVGDAHVALVVDDDVLAGAPGGRFALTAGTADAQQLLGRPGVVSAAYAVVADDAARQRVADAVAGVATVGPPAPHVPTALVTVRQALAGMTVAGVVVGVLIAVGSMMLAVDARRQTVATALVVGSSRRRERFGFAVEGAALGLIGGLVGLPLGHALGTVLVGWYGAALLAGTGATLSPRFELSEAALALGSGALMGVVAVALVSRGMVAEGPLASLHGATGSGGRRRSVPRWLLPAGVALAGAALVVMQRFGRGATPFAAGQGALFLGSFGALGVTLMLAPRLARRLTGALVRRAPADGLLVRVEVDRLPVRVAATVTTLAMGTALAVAFASIAPLGARTTSQRFADANGPGLLVTTQQPWDQREGSVSEAVAAAIRGLPEVGSVSTRWRAVVSDETEPRLLVAFDGPAADHAVTPLAGTAVPSALAGEGVALSRIAAARLGAGAGDTVTLPTLTGPAPFTVSGVFDPVVVDDTTVGDWVLTDPDTARHRFGAAATQLVVEPAAGVAAQRAATAVRSTGAVLAMDRDAWRAQAGDGLDRWFRPFTLTGGLIVIAAGIAVANMLVLGLIQMRRTRATLRALGEPVAGERRVLVLQSAIVAVAAAAFGAFWSQFFTFLLALASPVYYGFRLDWAVATAPLLWGVLACVALGMLGVAPPLWLAGRLKLGPALSAE